jgi:hypothetical protein
MEGVFEEFDNVNTATQESMKMMADFIMILKLEFIL